MICWSTLKDIISLLVPIIALAIAYSGLKTWKRQLQGTTEYDLARRVLRSTYELRDAITSFRHPIRFISPIEVDKSINPEEKRFLEEKNDWEQRRKKIDDLFPQYITNKVESEVLFGEKSVEGLNELIHLCNEIFIAAHMHLIYINPKSKHLDTHSERYMNEENKRTKILYAGIEGKDADEIQKRIDIIIKKIESYFKEYLPHNN